MVKPDIPSQIIYLGKTKGGLNKCHTPDCARASYALIGTPKWTAFVCDGCFDKMLMENRQ